jgi:hypothetical protein
VTAVDVSENIAPLAVTIGAPARSVGVVIALISLSIDVSTITVVTSPANPSP